MRSNSVNYIVTCLISFRTMRFNKFKFNISFHAYSICWNMKRENALNVPKYNKDLFAPHFFTFYFPCALCVWQFFTDHLHFQFLSAPKFSRRGIWHPKQKTCSVSLHIISFSYYPEIIENIKND